MPQGLGPALGLVGALGPWVLVGACSAAGVPAAAPGKLSLWGTRSKPHSVEVLLLVKLFGEQGRATLASVALSVSLWSSRSDSMPDVAAWQDTHRGDDLRLVGEDPGQERPRHCSAEEWNMSLDKQGRGSRARHVIVLQCEERDGSVCSSGSGWLSITRLAFSSVRFF